MTRPFEGLLVLDATHVLAGPYCGYLLALLGADVIKIEAPDMPDPVRGRGPVPALNDAGLGFNYLIQNANKRAMTLNLKSAAGKTIFRTLAAKADVVLENFRAGAFEALGLGYEDIKAINPRVVYGSITAFGQEGAWRQRTAYDPVIQAMSGITQRTGAACGQPVMPGAPFVDYATGLNAAFAVASALFRRERTGQGERIDCTMIETALVMTGPAMIADAYHGPKTATPREAGTDCYVTQDGHFQLGAYNFRQNARLWTALGRPDFAALNSWPAIWANAEAMRAALIELMKTRTSAEWKSFCAGIGVPGARVQQLQEAVASANLEERGFLHRYAPLPGFEGVAIPLAGFKSAEAGPRIDSPPPGFGEHTDSILQGLGYSAADIVRLRADAVI